MSSIFIRSNDRAQLIRLRINELKKYLNPKFLRYVFHILKRFFRYLWITHFDREEESMEFRNVEGLTEYNFQLPSRVKKMGVCAFIRAKNEEDKILSALGSIFDVFDQIIVVDNGSSDKTLSLVEQFKEKFDTQNKITVLSYPFSLSRWGPEYAATPENSLNSMVYFSNYAMSHSQYSWVFKWDADMLMRIEAKPHFRRFLKRVKKGRYTRWAFVGQNLYKGTDGKYYTSSHELDRETRMHPFNYHNRFCKSEDVLFEVFWSPLPRRLYNHVLFYELKYSDADEFSNWSKDHVYHERGLREMKNLDLLQKGQSPGIHYDVHDDEFVQRHIAYTLN